MCLCVPWLAGRWQEVRIYCAVCFLNLHQQASCTATDGGWKCFSRQDYTDRLLWSVGPAPSITRLFHGRSSLPGGLDIWTLKLRHLLRCWKTSQSRPPPSPAASEYEARHVLRRALPIIPLCEADLAPSCRGCCRLAKRPLGEKENKREGTAKVEERWPRCLCQQALESILSLFVYNWSCGVWCSATQNCNNSPFYDVVLTFPKLCCWPGTVTLHMIYCAAEYMLHYWSYCMCSHVAINKSYLHFRCLNLTAVKKRGYVYEMTSIVAVGKSRLHLHVFILCPLFQWTAVHVSFHWTVLREMVKNLA